MRRTSRLPHFIFSLALAGLTGAPQAVFAKQIVRVGVYENPPKIHMQSDSQSEEPSGIFGDLLQAIAEREDWQLTAVPCNWDDCLHLLSDGDIDLLPDVAFTPERTRLFSYHQVPAMLAWSQVYTRAGEEVSSPMDLQGRSIAVLADSVQQAYLSNLTAGFEVDARFVEVASVEAAFAAVRAGEADLAVANQLFGDYKAANFGLEPTAMVFQPVDLFYATPLNQGEDLRERIDYWLTEWKEKPDSPYYQALSRWSAEKVRVAPTFLLWALGGLVAALVLAIGFVALLRRQVAEKTGSLKASENYLSVLLSNVDSLIYVKGTDFRYNYVNQRMIEFLGMEKAEILGKRDEDLFTDETVVGLRETDQRVIKTGERIMEEEIGTRRDSTDPRTFLTVKQPLRDEDGVITGLVGVSTDITEQLKSEQRIHRLAFYDSLTGLPNQRLLTERLEEAAEKMEQSESRGAVLFIDLDNFRDLNDILGHKAGDRLLVQVADRMQLRVREDDTLARFGGDEFVLVVEGLDSDAESAAAQVEHLAGDLRKLIKVPFNYDDHSFEPTASIGAALFNGASQHPGDLIKWAELAMYQAKLDGRNKTCFYDPAMQAELHSRAKLEAGIRHGLENGEFELHYQPQFDAQHRLVGLEALVRWTTASGERVSPGEFIPVAESTGLIRPLGHWILNEACQQLVRWSSHPQLSGIRVSVNISAHQLHEKAFVAEVIEALEQTGTNPALLELELTESLLVRNVEQTIEKMAQLCEKGVRFSLDDFGTGYSSLTYLKRLPLNQLKIDQGFVQDLLTDPNDAAIVRTVVALGESLDLSVIAEGVETQEQREALLGYGCQQFQGYLLGRPMAPVDLEAFVTNLS
ncbi:EAL domain-containing protein [Marinobacterium mangrovicola]|uniref:Periplasmic sensor diguanylate cyclase/phosphodiesterase n=1 Tax=Marinobacterium mangrovicola TaxID=1476959 RepID=A0A4R1GEI8_9GAMM|nr:EAL domain-containing protein [Marinobacterium mangrovicola]TCK04179.1 periplasmic sensor diguanylate cyclase/phosphodiesterase [Marinobacterium mangrovicola]